MRTNQKILRQVSFIQFQYFQIINETLYIDRRFNSIDLLITVGFAFDVIFLVLAHYPLTDIIGVIGTGYHKLTSITNRDILAVECSF